MKRWMAANCRPLAGFVICRPFSVACLKLWLMDRHSGYLDQSLVFVASFLHNCERWNSEIGQARYYTNFFGVTCLHDAPYMAAYECFETFAAFDEYLRLGYDDIPPAAKLLLCEYRRFAQDFTWYFYGRLAGRRRGQGQVAQRL